MKIKTILTEIQLRKLMEDIIEKLDDVYFKQLFKSRVKKEALK